MAPYICLHGCHSKAGRKRNQRVYVAWRRLDWTRAERTPRWAIFNLLLLLQSIWPPKSHGGLISIRPHMRYQGAGAHLVSATFEMLICFALLCFYKLIEWGSQRPIGGNRMHKVIELSHQILVFVSLHPIICTTKKADEVGGMMPHHIPLQPPIMHLTNQES